MFKILFLPSAPLLPFMANILFSYVFSCPEQLNRWPCHSLTHSQYFYFWHTKNDPRDLWPLRHLIRVMRRHELTEKDLPTYRVFFLQKSPNFPNISKIFRKSPNFPNISKFSDNLKNFRKSYHFPKIFVENFVEKSFKHSETGKILLMCPWHVKIAWKDLNLSSQMAINSSHIPLRTCWNSKYITDAPLACGDNRLRKATK